MRKIAQKTKNVQLLKLWFKKTKTNIFALH